MIRELVDAYCQDDDAQLAGMFPRFMEHVGISSVKAVQVIDESTVEELANGVLGGLVSFSDVDMRRIHLSEVINTILGMEEKEGKQLVLRREDLLKSDGVPDLSLPRTVLIATSGKAQPKLQPHLESGLVAAMVRKPYGTDIIRNLASIARRIGVAAALESIGKHNARSLDPTRRRP